MRSSGKFIAAVLLLLFLSTPSMAEIISAKIRSDTRHMILFSEFEYSHTGDVSVTVSSVGITSNSSQPDPSRIGFFLLSNEFADRYDLELKQNPDLCALDINFITQLLFTLGNLSSHAQSFYNETHHVTHPGLYSLYLANCNNLSLTMDVRAELYNIDGTTKDYLSAAQPQPSLYLTFSLIYLWFLGFWIKLCFKNQQCVEMIHLVMGLLLLTTLVYFVSAAANQIDLKVTGTHHSLFVFYMYQFMRNVLFFAVIMLIGIGWCFWNRIWPEREISFLGAIILIQVFNVTLTLGEPGLYIVDRGDVEGTSTALDVVCCIAVFVSTLVAVTVELREASRDTKRYVRWSYSSLKETSANPYLFLVLLIVYLFIRGALQFRVLDIPREFTLAQETTTLVFSMVVFYMYRPFLDDKDEKSGSYWCLGDTC